MTSSIFGVETQTDFWADVCRCLGHSISNGSEARRGGGWLGRVRQEANGFVTLPNGKGPAGKGPAGKGPMESGWEHTWARPRLSHKYNLIRSRIMPHRQLVTPINRGTLSGGQETYRHKSILSFHINKTSTGASPSETLLERSSLFILFCYEKLSLHDGHSDGKFFGAQSNWLTREPYQAADFNFDETHIHVQSTFYRTYSGAFKVGFKWGEVAENRPQTGRFGLSFTRNFVPKR